MGFKLSTRDTVRLLLYRCIVFKSLSPSQLLALHAILHPTVEDARLLFDKKCFLCNYTKGARISLTLEVRNGFFPHVKSLAILCMP